MDEELFGRRWGYFHLRVMLTPNLFGLCAYRGDRLPLASMWFLTTYCFWKGLSHWKWSVVLGSGWGLALATKSRLADSHFVNCLGACIHRDKYAIISRAVVLAPVAWCHTPYLWHERTRVLAFLYEGSAGLTGGREFHDLFFSTGSISRLNLPWHYPFLIVGVTTPGTALDSALIGALATPWLRQQRACLCYFLPLQFLFYDGAHAGGCASRRVRQMLAALPFIAALAGRFFVLLKGYRIGERAGELRKFVRVKSTVTVVLFVLVCAGPTFDLIVYHPFQLSFYNRFVGGIRGAYSRGLEITYFLEALNSDFLQILNKRIPENATITASFANFMLRFYQQEGQLRKDIKITPTDFDFYRCLCRSVLGPGATLLMNQGNTFRISERGASFGGGV